MTDEVEAGWVTAWVTLKASLGGFTAMKDAGWRPYGSTAHLIPSSDAPEDKAAAILHSYGNPQAVEIHFETQVEHASDAMMVFSAPLVSVDTTVDVWINDIPVQDADVRCGGGEFYLFEPLKAGDRVRLTICL